MNVFYSKISCLVTLMSQKAYFLPSPPVLKGGKGSEGEGKGEGKGGEKVGKGGRAYRGIY